MKSFEKTKEGNEFDSFFRTESVFTGEYWDEFSLFGSDRPLKTLVIGCGNGACIRPILASAPKTHLTLIDIDKNALAATKSIYQEHFEKLKFKTLHKDACNLESLEGGYDLIWLDIYTDKGFPDFLNFGGYFVNLKKLLSTTGTLAINVFTTPAFFAVNSLGKAESYFLKRMKSLFEKPQLIPFRRNVTIFSKPWAEDSSITASLKPMDKLMRKTQRIRISNSFELSPLSIVHRLPTFKEISREMMGRWESFDASRQDTLVPNSERIHQVLLDHHGTKNSILGLYRGHEQLLPEVPTLMGAFIGSGNSQHLLYLESLLEIAPVILERSKNILIHFYLPQITAIAANLSSCPPTLVKKIDALITRI